MEYQFTGLTLFRTWDIDNPNDRVWIHNSWYFDTREHAQEACDMMNLVEGPDTHTIRDNGKYEKPEYRYEVWTEFYY